jgi:hypothetical protein
MGSVFENLCVVARVLVLAGCGFVAVFQHAIDGEKHQYG